MSIYIKRIREMRRDAVLYFVWSIVVLSFAFTFPAFTLFYLMDMEARGWDLSQIIILVNTIVLCCAFYRSPYLKKKISSFSLTELRYHMRDCKNAIKELKTLNENTFEERFIKSNYATSYETTILFPDFMSEYFDVDFDEVCNHLAEVRNHVMQECKKRREMEARQLSIFDLQE
jgi:hypothetical protein